MLAVCHCNICEPVCVYAETTIVVCADLHDWSQLVSDEVIVQRLDVANLRVISHVLSQSVALDYFNS